MGHRNKLSDDDVRAIRAAFARGERQVDIAMRFHVTEVAVSLIVRRLRRADVSDEVTA